MGITIENLKPVAQFKSDELVDYGARATSANVNRAPLFIKEELNKLFNFVKVKFNELPIEWSTNQDYKIGDLVEKDDKIYRALTNNTNSEPPSDDWEELNLSQESLDNKYVQLDASNYLSVYDLNSKKAFKVGTDTASALRTSEDGLLPYSNESSNLGSSDERFNEVRAKTVYADDFMGTSSSAKYADLAERYYADDIYEPGTVLGIGGEKEVTLYQPGMPLAGVVSTAPAFKMNDDTNENHEKMPFIALKGKIPVKVSTNVSKGDYMLASEDVPGEAYGVQEMDFEMSKRFLGIALEDYTDNVNGGTVNIKV